MKLSQQVFYETAQALSAIPTIIGIMIRRVFYRLTLKKCGTSLIIEYLSIITNRQACFGDNVWVGSYCIIGNAHIGNNVMIASHSCILSQSKGHKNKSRHVATTQTKIGSDCWIGTHVTIKAHVSANTIVGAGAVVTKTHPPNQTLIGIPAKPL